MVLGLIQLGALACLGVLVWYAGEALPVVKRLDISFDRLRAFLDAKDINRRNDEAEEIAEVTADRTLVRAWLPGTQILLGKLLASTERIGTLGEELIAPGRSTVVTPAPHPMTRASESEGMRRTSGYHATFSPASAPVLPSAPAQIAAGLGPRPQSTSGLAKTPTSRPHSPPVKLPSRRVTPEVSRSATLTGGAEAASVEPVAPPSTVPDHDPEQRMSWEALKRAGMIGSTIRPPTVADPRFPGTMLSMQAVVPPGPASPSSARSVAPVQVKETCRGCDSGFVRVGEGGIRRCGVCAGSGFVETAPRL